MRKLITLILVAISSTVYATRLSPVEVESYKLLKGGGSGWPQAIVYEWTPKYNSNIQCVYIESSGVSCYPMETENTQLEDMSELLESLLNESTIHNHDNKDIHNQNNRRGWDYNQNNRRGWDYNQNNRIGWDYYNT